jgi:two-component system phosphate regulon sensor histidine kinase PhoR
LINPWIAEISLMAGLVLAALVLGLLSGHVLLALWLTTLAYLVWHLYKLQRLEDWLSTGAGPPPRGGRGVWGEVYYQLYRLRQHHRRRKRTIAQYLHRFREFTAAMPDATVVLRRSGEIEWFNEAAGRLLGLSSPQDIGQRIINLVRHPLFIQHFRAQRFGDPVEFPSPDDEGMILSVSVVPYGKEQLLLVARDNTRLHKLEQVRRDFVANVSHELRTPLTVISGFLETLADNPKTRAQDRQHALELMSQQTTRMQHIVEELLLLARLETDQRPVRREQVPVSTLLHTIHDEARTLSGGKHDIHLEAQEGLDLRGNAEELRSAFTNLVSNAVRYTPPGGRIIIRWYGDDAGAHFQVEDTGVGIAEHDIPRLTERFYRVDAARSRQSGGTGLGLAIVKHVLERHDATLEIGSKLGIGSTFTCHFPQSAVALRPMDVALGGGQ